MEYHGSCLCGGITYTVRGELGKITYCHCSMCRKAQGTAGAMVAPVRSEQFELLTGEDLLSVYETDDGKQRVFCQQCGSPLYSRLVHQPAFIRLRIGTLDSELVEGISAHIFVDSKASWDQILDELPQHPEREPDRRLT